MERERERERKREEKMMTMVVGRDYEEEKVIGGRGNGWE